jgi:uncharacterized lipoprotein
VKRVFIGVGSVLLIFGMSACSSSSTSEGKTEGTYQYVKVETPKGPVDCIVWDGFKAGNITCDWN